jgi:ketosteroid isomerase-like protein
MTWRGSNGPGRFGTRGGTPPGLRPPIPWHPERRPAPRRATILASTLKRMRAMADIEAEIERLEERLRTAMETSNVAELDALIDDRLMFVGPDGLVYDKEDDLGLHRSGEQQLTRVELRNLAIEVHGATAITIVESELAGVFKGESFAGRYRYLRVWSRSDDGWRIIAGSVCAVPRYRDGGRIGDEDG